MTRQSEALFDQVRAFATEVVARAAPGWEQARAIPREAMTAAAKLGLFGLQVPEELGGMGLAFSVKAEIAEILGAADFGFAMSVINTQNVAQKLARDAPRDVAMRYVPDLLAARRLGSTALTEPHAGSDFAAITTRATRDGDGWVLNGEKAWIINAAASDVIVLYAQTEPGAGGRGIAAFLVDGTRPGFDRQPAFQMSGQHTIGAGGFRLENYRVAHDEMLQPPGLAFRAALDSINGARIYVAAICVGMVGAALEIARDYGMERVSFGQALIAHQGWRWPLAEAETDLAAARLMVADAAAMIDAGIDAQFAAARTKIFATRMAEVHLPKLAQLMGAEGLRESYPFGRHLIGARVAGFVDGSTEMLRERLTAPYLKK